MVTVCCICQKTKTNDGWISRALADHEFPSHGYCPACGEEVIRELRALRAPEAAAQAG